MHSLFLKEIKFEWVRLFLLNVQRQLDCYENLFLYLTNDGENGFIKADIKHQSLHDVEICAVSEILAKDEDITDTKVLKVLELLGYNAYLYALNEGVEISVNEIAPEYFEKGLEKLELLRLSEINEDRVETFLTDVQEIWEEELFDCDELYLTFNCIDQEFVVKPYEGDKEYMKICSLNAFVEPYSGITDNDIDDCKSYLKNYMRKLVEFNEMFNGCSIEHDWRNAFQQFLDEQTLPTNSIDDDLPW